MAICAEELVEPPAQQMPWGPRGGDTASKWLWPLDESVRGNHWGSPVCHLQYHQSRLGIQPHTEELGGLSWLQTALVVIDTHPQVPDVRQQHLHMTMTLLPCLSAYQTVVQVIHYPETAEAPRLHPYTWWRCGEPVRWQRGRTQILKILLSKANLRNLLWPSLIGIWKFVSLRSTVANQSARTACFTRGTVKILHLRGWKNLFRPLRSTIGWSVPSRFGIRK